MRNRRTFIKEMLAGALVAHTAGFPALVQAAPASELLTILHTNDVHSRIEPFPEDDKKYTGMGGAAPRAALIEKLRRHKEQVLLLDAGDIFQGTPYFNFFHGDVEIDVMNQMGYNAATIGNHDFDGGMDNLARQIGRANFPFVNCNYDFSNTVLAGKVHPYVVIKKGRLKIGITGCGVELEGLVPEPLYGKTKYLSPVECVQQQVDILRGKHQCHLVICLSHLGYQYDSAKVSDKVLAQQTHGIDVIIGGHTHTFLEQPFIAKNNKGKEVLINQVGWAGLQLGVLDYKFEKKSGKKIANYQTVIVDKKSIAI